jgi:ubiquitin carboxyl-terminal hydrolase 25
VLVDAWSRAKRSYAQRTVRITTPLLSLVTHLHPVVSELADLFWHLEHADNASVTPTMELAKLALVTSKDEEDDIEQTATDSSNDTDATLVEDALPPRTGTITGSPVGSPGTSSSSILGKRSREKEIGSRMSIDSVTDKDNYVIISKSPDAGPSGGGDAAEVEMKDAEAPAQSGPKPPPLPPRKTSESVMMFGASDTQLFPDVVC